MIENKTNGFATVFCFFVLALSFAAGANIASGQCAKTTDEQIVANIYGRIKADKDLASQIPHVNVTSVSQAVKFQGWADSKSDYDQFESIGLSTDCARVVNVNEFLDAPPADGSSVKAMRGCVSGTKACGDICIPTGDVCNINGFVGENFMLFRTNFDNGRELFGFALGTW